MIRLLTIGIFGIFCVAYSLSMTTQKPHHGGHGHHGTGPTVEPSEHENFKFIYEPHSHMMIVVNGHKCYMFMLSDSEKAAIHTDAGIRAVELKLLGTLSTASVTEVTKDKVAARVVHACGAHITHYYLQTYA
ncbi:uncharacterized protein LOC132751702 [Ruditapes philippinarum]|uniref:uncharacterized protein LOC132751702 n=1 Tax=Ruditapes philippinarum TaxID=129788 RepID=UPI00295B3785|nr:uncharacterized protein LOC132751702 [Ruditapes philippinarum]